MDAYRDVNRDGNGHGNDRRSRLSARAVLRHRHRGVSGGLDAIERFFDNLPKDTGMAFVIVQHLSPDFKSMMDELLARHTQLPIHLGEDGMLIEADHVYLNPPKNEMIIRVGAFS
jgi:hypothetical protein